MLASYCYEIPELRKKYLPSESYGVIPAYFEPLTSTPPSPPKWFENYILFTIEINAIV